MPYTSIKISESSITAWSRKKMFELGTQCALIIIQRAQHGGDAGHGLDDRPHKTYKQSGGKGKSLGAYSASHGKIRSEGGKYNRIKIGGGLPINRVTLSVIGQMFRQFRALNTSAKKFSITLKPTGGSAKYAGHVNNRRPWIGFSPKDQDKIRNVFRAIWVQR